MRRENTRAALDLYDELAEADTQSGASMPSHSLVLVHAVLRPESGPEMEQWQRVAGAVYPVFLDAADQQRAACGLRMKVVLPFGFDDADGDACERCRAEVARWALNADAWWQEQRRWEQRKRVRGDGIEDVAVWRALEDRRRSAVERRAEVDEPDR